MDQGGIEQCMCFVDCCGFVDQIYVYVGVGEVVIEVIYQNVVVDQMYGSVILQMKVVIDEG